jgi:hypothetical protein
MHFDLEEHMIAFWMAVTAVSVPLALLVGVLIWHTVSDLIFMVDGWR